MKTTLILLLMFAWTVQAQTTPERWKRQNCIQNGLTIEKPVQKLPMNCEAYQRFKVKTVASVAMGGALIVVFSPYIGVGFITLSAINYQINKKGKGRFINNHKTCRK